ncbi:MAG TPA: ATP-grasp domain-containing protein [Candidatus Nitrosocosmicus sp.]|jgi:succinyl-CoA synthetase beta subunit|uniref:succinate--CoA ligase subunit beta n=1 Tax=Candidatus Nitrosocosmicus agrestis TaxID=2563600 RepID=UPI00122E1B97|nr:ATP-grasp domain-containing protein [Candidatus Nitrosocosmicus sp. SS]KAA2280804.1 ATP-grasp domain-containing protein [Candidatus Nitrosocosmicus sp. SS]KAF0868889.1 ATP-grasp domain-containing protein [Candidatus Nitrosocosmicus sp. SS]MDR4492136.1 acetate--CoA ligase family protein [Candidatus Nitrosocosmicus sp.]HET6589749.1 ATP-grasp domain-containing protein [Candidatus Nitrosocosmicus sp.]
MRLLEYQGKELFSQVGINIPESILAQNIDSAKMAAEKLGFPFVLKSQLTVGGRGKAGAIQKCKDYSELESKFDELVHKEVKGELPRGILLEKMVEIVKEIYLSVFLNRSKRCYSIIASSEGGVDIEQTENKVILNVSIDGITGEQSNEVAVKLDIPPELRTKFVDLLNSLFRVIIEKEAELAEINPLAIVSNGSFVALDAKVIIDDNALFRHTDLQKYLFLTDLEKQASDNGFSFVELDGDIAIIGNGAGLVMSTLDMVTDANGTAGSFLDFGGRATSETIYEALKVISRIPKIKAILVNLFGGIVRTDLVAQGILDAYKNNILKVPVYARISGAESERAKELLKGSDAKLFDTVEEAINAVVLKVTSNI